MVLDSLGLLKGAGKDLDRRWVLLEEKIKLKFNIVEFKKLQERVLRNIKNKICGQDFKTEKTFERLSISYNGSGGLIASFNITSPLIEA